MRKLFEEAEVIISDAVLGRDHRVSKNNYDVIIRFTFFCHRTLLYFKVKI